MELVQLKLHSPVDESVGAVIALASLLELFSLTEAHGKALFRYFNKLFHGFRRDCCPPHIQLVGDSESQNSWDDEKTLDSRRDSNKDESTEESEGSYSDDKNFALGADSDEDDDEAEEDESKDQEKVQDIAGLPTILPFHEGRRCDATARSRQDATHDVVMLHSMLSTHIAHLLKIFIHFLMTPEESKKDRELSAYVNVVSFTKGGCVMRPLANKSPLTIHGVVTPGKCIATMAEDAVSPLASPSVASAPPAGASPTTPSTCRTAVKRVPEDGPIAARTRSGENLSMPTGDPRFYKRSVNVLVTMELPLDILSFLETVGLNDPELHHSLGDILELPPLTNVKSSMTIRFLLLVVLILKDNSLTHQLNLVHGKVLFLELARFFLMLSVSKKENHQEPHEFQNYKENMRSADPSKFPLLVNLYGVSYQELLKRLRDVPDNKDNRASVREYLANFSTAPRTGKRKTVNRKLNFEKEEKKSRSQKHSPTTGQGDSVADTEGPPAQDNDDIADTEGPPAQDNDDMGTGNTADDSQGSKADTTTIENCQTEMDNINGNDGTDEKQPEGKDNHQDSSQSGKGRNKANLDSIFASCLSQLSATAPGDSLRRACLTGTDKDGGIERWRCHMNKKSEPPTTGWMKAKLSDDVSAISYKPLLGEEICLQSISPGGGEEMADPELRARAAMSFFGCRMCAAMYLVATGGPYLANKKRIVKDTLEKDLPMVCATFPSLVTVVTVVTIVTIVTVVNGERAVDSFHLYPWIVPSWHRFFSPGYMPRLLR